MDFADRYGPAALIAGGSEGVGLAFAHRLIAQGLEVILVARKQAALEQAQAELRRDHVGARVRIISADLATEQGVAGAIDAVAGAEIGLLIYNAGACSWREDFVDGDLDFNLRLAALNVTSKMRMVHAFGGPMKRRGRGGLILVGSMASLAGIPGLATYCGSKSFSNVFGEALWAELKPHGVDVLCCPLPQVNTPAMARNYPHAAELGVAPEAVVDAALAHIADGPVLYPQGAADWLKQMAQMERADVVAAVTKLSAAYSVNNPASDPRLAAA